MRTARIILVPIDFGDASIAALDHAVDLAERTNARLYVLHAFEVPMLGLPDSPVTAVSELTSRILEAARRGLDDTLLRYDGRKVVITPVLKQGDAREVILVFAEELGADLICMGTHGRRGLARVLIGSVAEAVVRTSRIPVLTVHAPDADAA